MSYLMNTYKKSDFCIVKGEGCTVFDTDNNAYLDFTSGIGVNALGYGNEKIINAIKTQSEKLLHISNLYRTENDEKVAEKLAKKLNMQSVFFANSGAEANEGAIKLARKYSYDKYGENRYEIITLVDSFHGRTISTLKATGQDKFHKYYMPFPDGFSYAKANDIEDVKSKVSDKTCAIMLEVIQGEGGVLPLDKDFLQNVQALCNEKDILFIVDEVQTGVGRTGEFCGYQNFDLNPDIVTLAKGLGGGLPIGAILAGDKTGETFSYSDHGSTFGGNPVSTAVANVIFDEMTDDFLKDITDKGDYFISKLKEIKSDYITDVRGIGLMIGMCLNDKKVNGDVAEFAKDNGILVLTAGNNTVRFLPPLTISKEDIDKCVEVIKKALA